VLLTAVRARQRPVGRRARRRVGLRLRENLAVGVVGKRRGAAGLDDLVRQMEIQQPSRRRDALLVDFTPSTF
jgi:hypothetical protein